VAVAGQQAVIVGTTRAIPENARTSASPDARTPVDIYDAATDTWLTAELSDTRWRDVSAIGLGNRVYVAGGGIGTDIYTNPVVSDAVDVYDADTGAWSTLRLSQARMGILPVVAGQQVLFAGGYTGFRGPARDVDWTDRVDIFDSATGAWSMAELTAGWRFLGFAVGDRAVFAGGFTGARSVVQPSRQADVYDSQTGTWSHQEALHQEYIEMPTAITLGPLGLVVSSKNVDVYDTRTGRWSTLPLPERRRDDPVATVGSRLLVPGTGDVVYIHDFDAPPP
jgi:hypothetical protein